MMTMGTRMQKKVWLRRDICLEEEDAVVSAMFCKPWYKADNVNNVNAMLKIAEVLVKAALSKVATESAGNGANNYSLLLLVPPAYLFMLLALLFLESV